MTKLMQWISLASAASAVWYSLIGGYVKHPLIQKYQNIIVLMPLILLLIFGMYSVLIVLFRVLSFNNCEMAAQELQEEIIEAREDLQSRGVKW